MQRNDSFNPLLFLAALGAGGISVMPFSFLQYTHHRGGGLVSWPQVGHGSLPIEKEILFYGLEAVMLVFALLHFGLMGVLLARLKRWLGSESYLKMLRDPLTNSALLAPFISAGMSFNVVIATVRFFVPAIAANLQAMMLPALVAWGLLWAVLLWTEIRLLGISFASSFDVSKVTFGWLLHPFALAMITVTGTGIAALSKSAGIAHTAAIMSAISGSMGLFLLAVKLTSVFTSHFSAPGLPDKQFLPSFLIVIPNLTLFAISGFRLVHYAERHFDVHASWLATVIVVAAFAFQTWYMLFGLSMLRTYMKKNFFGQEFHVSQWGLICPFVAYAVLGSFLHAAFVPSPLLYGVILAVMTASVGMYAMLLAKQRKCARVRRVNAAHDCSAGLVAQPS